jgi:hypothetical protein
VKYLLVLELIQQGANEPPVPPWEHRPDESRFHHWSLSHRVRVLAMHFGPLFVQRCIGSPEILDRFSIPSSYPEVVESTARCYGRAQTVVFLVHRQPI